MWRWAVRWRPGRESGRRPRCPVLAGRSARNYPHLVAERLGLDLVDVTYSGATTAQCAHRPTARRAAADRGARRVRGPGDDHDRRQRRRLRAAAVRGGSARLARSLPLLGGRLRDQLDPAARDRALAEVAESLNEVGRTLRQRSPRARVLFVDYLTLLPPPGTPAPPLSDADVATGRHVADTLERLTAEAAADTGCGLVRVAEPSLEHHAWSADPWTTKFGLPLPGPPGAASPQRNRYANGRGPSRGTGNLKSWAR